MVTRRIKELKSGIENRSGKVEINETISTLKYVMDELGALQDEYMSHVGEEDHDVAGQAEKWYFEYDRSCNKAISSISSYKPFDCLG